MINAVVFGVTGYTGIELIRILSRHPEARIRAGASRQWAGSRASAVFPYIDKDCDFPIMGLEDLLDRPQADVAFLALPHGQSATLVRPLLDKGVKVVDLSADCRLEDPEVYAEWYGDHGDPGILGEAVYGLPEVHRAALRTASLVANPGCYPTSVILAVLPLMKNANIETSTMIADSKSGISGAGRGQKLTTSFCESGEGFKPYGVLGHRHIPEMEQELSQIVGDRVRVRFTPHLIPVSRGMVSTVYLRALKPLSIDELRTAYHTAYRDEPFVKVLPAGNFPDTIHVRGCNDCHVAVEYDERTERLIAMSALDNLVKGASGAAVQNMNLIMGIEETTGLRDLPLFP